MKNFCLLPTALALLIAFVKFLDTPAGFHITLTPGKERMTFGANIDAQFFFGGAGFKSIATTTNDSCLKIFRMNFIFQNEHLKFKKVDAQIVQGVLYTLPKILARFFIGKFKGVKIEWN